MSASSAPTPGQLEAPLRLHYASGLMLAGESVRLLEAIAGHGSISSAAKAIGISYRTAWERVESLNNLADTPLAARAAGGKGGGGTRLTPAGERLLALFHALESEHRRFLDRLADRIGHDDAPLATLRRLAMQTSARNEFHGLVSAIRRGAVNAEIRLDIGNDNTVTAIITEESLSRLGLTEGGDAVAVIKASSVIVTTEPAASTSARNHLCGTVSRLHRGAVNADVVIDVGNGKSVGAIITNVSAEQLGLREGARACALFKASSVILAKSG